MIVLDGLSLTCAGVAAIGRRQSGVQIDSAGRDRARAAADVVRAVTSGREVYGRTTGVGANRGVSVSPAEARAHGLRLARSHAGGGGPLLPRELAIAMLAVRANQIAAGGSGVDPGVLDVLADSVNRGCAPPARIYGGIGTGDLAALAVTALCLLGERDWLAPDPAPAVAGTDADGPRFALAATDALAFMSSNALTLAEGAIACNDLSLLLQAGTVTAALSHLGATASAEPYSAAVQSARPHPGQQRVAGDLRALLSGQPGPAARVQDPYGFRALPQVQGAAVDAVAYASAVVDRELNAASENPLVDVPGRRIWHNGNFHTGYVALALDAARAAVYQAAALSAARLSALMDNRITGLSAFLATEPAGSSGLMILEYTANSALAELRQLAAPVTAGGAVVSLGAEEHAGFGTQAARSATDAVQAYRVVLAGELTAAVRAIRMRTDQAGAAVPLVAGELSLAFQRAASVLSDDLADRPLDGDLLAAAHVLDELPRGPR